MSVMTLVAILVVSGGLFLIGLAVGRRSINQVRKENDWILDRLNQDTDRLKKLNALDELFLFYIGDKMHNFGDEHTGVAFTLEPDLHVKIRTLFLVIKAIGRDHRYALHRLPSGWVDISKELESEISSYLNQSDDMECKRVLYNLVLLGFDQIGTKISCADYRDAYFPKTLEEFLALDYGIKEKYYGLKDEQ